MRPVPRWARVAFWAFLALRRATGVVQVVLEELICAWVPPAARPGLTSEVFRRLTYAYAPDGVVHSEGMWAWELAALAEMGVSPGDSIAVGAAGGGREIDTLLALGYRARGFDPAPVADLRSDIDIVRATYADLVAAVLGHDSPLTTFASEHFDGVILGWGSWNHVLTDADRHDLLCAIRARWPHASVMLSYEDRREERNERPPLAGLRRRIRARLGTDRRSPGVEFLMSGGFMCFPTHESVAAAAAAAGYAVRYAGGPYSHDVLVPITEA